MIEGHLVKTLHTADGKLTLDVHLRVAAGELLALTGSSGAGKTTLLRLLAGLSRPDAGYIRVANETWVDVAAGRWLRPQARRLGLVFQDYALFPNMTVRQNLTFALRSNQDTALVQELIEVVELEGLQHRYPQQLSGGQQQRVALARALAARPQVLLLDEPLSALDAPLRSRLQDYLLVVHRRYALTTILVTHDQREIMKLADRALELRQGQLHPTDLPTRTQATELPAPLARLRAEILGWTDDAAGTAWLVMFGANLLRLPASPTHANRYQPGATVWLRWNETAKKFDLDPN